MPPHATPAPVQTKRGSLASIKQKLIILSIAMMTGDRAESIRGLQVNLQYRRIFYQGTHTYSVLEPFPRKNDHRGGNRRKESTQQYIRNSTIRCGPRLAARTEEFLQFHRPHLVMRILEPQPQATFRNFQNEDYRTEGPWSDRRFPMHTGKNVRAMKFDGHASDSFFLFPGVADHYTSTKLHHEVFEKRLPSGSLQLRKATGQHLKLECARRPEFGITPATVDGMFDHPGR